MTPNADVAHAIDDAYAAFASYKRPVALDAAPTRDAAAILRTLTASPLRELSGEQIGPYSGWAVTTVGMVEDYKHFLPRILEQAVRAPQWMGTMPEILAGRLNYSELRTWPRAEQDAVTRLFWAAWNQARQLHPDDGDTAEWLCGLGVLGEDIAQALETWLAPPSANAALQVARFAMSARETLLGSGGVVEGTWAPVAEAVRVAVASWRDSDGVRETLRRTTVAERDAWTIAAALAVPRLSRH